MNVIDFLKMKRKEGMKVKDIAALCGYHPVMITNLINRGKEPSIITKEKIAKGFGLNTSFFLNEGEGKEKRILSLKEEKLLEIIGNDQMLMDKTIEFAEKEKMYLEAKEKGKKI